MPDYEIRGGTGDRLGAIADGEGTNFAVFSQNAQRVELCLFSPDGSEETARLSLPEKTGPVWHGHVPGLAAGQLYGYRVHGQYAPEQGHRFNPNKLLLDPYMREMRGRFESHSACLGYDDADAAQDLSFSSVDSAPHMPKSVVSDPDILRALRDRADPRAADELIYEAHVKGVSQLHEGVAEKVRGSYEALCSDAMIAHLQKLGVSTVELLPVHSFVDDTFLVERGLRNYWGYNSIGFFAPEPRYFGPEGMIGFRKAVARLKEAGISVILDVVYNHTAEGDQRGPTLSYRGLDNASYYRLNGGQRRYYVNDTGCGNTLNVSHPYVLRMVMDSLRFWVQSMGVDGFRFDLASTLGREDHGFDPNGGFFDALRQDPVLATARMIAEPWDIGPGGYRLGEFPHEFSEWNDQYRDTVRRYWRGDAHSAQEMGSRLLGSAERFDQDGRRASASLNFISSHDGFTLADITRYNQRHNEANTENNQDGHHSNFSDNCGVEGETDDPAIRARREKRQRNMLATLFVSQGTPMLLAGDEIGNSQAGNNNAYCQDNEIGWINWDSGDAGLLAFTQKLSRLRRAHPVLRQSRFLHGDKRASDGEIDVAWSDFEGGQLHWRDPGLSCFCVTLRCSADAPSYEPDGDEVFLIFNRDEEAAEVVVPKAPSGAAWVRKIDTAEPELDVEGAEALGTLMAQGRSVVILALEPGEAEG
jgi:glycogen operon protein